MTRLRRDRKLLQTFRIKSFLIEAHERLTEDFNSSTLLWRTLQNHALNTRPDAVAEGVQVRRLWRPEVLGPKVHV